MRSSSCVCGCVVARAYGSPISIFKAVDRSPEPDAQTGSGVRATSYPMGTEGSFPGGKAARGVKLTTHLQLVRGQENVYLYIHYPIRLHGVVLN
jgi:hypothetical protein